MTVWQFQRNLSRVIENLEAIVLDSAMVFSSTIADLNVKQLEQGKRIDDKPIVPEYQSDIYAKSKKAIGSQSPIGTPDLKLTGSFHSGIYASKKGNEYIYTYSTDSKADKLNSKYRMIFGLTTESIKELKPDVQSELYKRITNELRKS